MKKLIAMLLALVMVFALVACSGNNEANDPAGAGDENFYETASYKGATLGDSRWDGSLPLVDDGYEITIGLRTSTLVSDYETNDFTLWLEEKTGLNITIQEFPGAKNDVATQLNLMISGEEEWPDIFIGNPIARDVTNEFGREGYILNLAGYFQTDAHYSMEMLKRYYPDEAEYDYALDQMWAVAGDRKGEGAYHFPHMFKAFGRNIAQVMINKVWLDKLGLQVPTNVEELYEVLVAFRDQDPNGNGLKDEVPMIGRDNVRSYDTVGHIINAYIQYLPTYRGIIENGKVSIPQIEDEYRQALIYLNKLCKEGLLSDLTFSATSADIKALLNVPEGQVQTVGVISFPLDETLDLGNPAIFDYEPLPVFTDETGRGGYGMWYADTWSTNMIINANTERPEVAFRLLDFLCSPEGYLNQRWGKQGVSWDWLPEGVDGTGKGHLGEEARIVVHNQNTYIEPSNETWHTQYSFCSEPYWARYMERGEDPWLDEMYDDMWEMKQMYIDAGQPEEMLYIFNRTDEEDELYQEYNTEIAEYINRSRAEFIVGQRDPADDAQWDQYLKNLDQLKVKECWLNVCQSAYDRYKAEKAAR